MVEDGGALAFDCVAEKDARMPFINKFGQLFASGFQWMLSKITPSQRQNVEGNHDCLSTPYSASKSMEVAVPVRMENDRLPVDQSGAAREGADTICDVYEVFGEIRCLTRPKPDLSIPLQGKKSISVVLKFVKPIRAARRLGH